MHILLVEDDDRVAAALRPALHRHGMTTSRLSRGRGVTEHLAGVDVVLLDLGLPDVDGVDVCRAIREAGDVPVIVVSARGEVHDRIEGLHCGADDYLVKPFDTGELLARMHAVLRRRAPAPAPGDPGEVVSVADVRVDTARHEVTVAGRSVSLTRKEFQILGLLATAGGTVVTRGRIVAEVWGRSWSGANRTLDVHVATLRTKLGRPELVATVRGVGYRLEVPEGVSVRARLLVIVLVVVGLVAVGLGGLLAWTTAQAAQQGFFTRRLTDTVYLASLMQRPVTEAESTSLDALLERYRQVYGVSVHVVAADGTPFAPSAAPALDGEGRDRLDAALAGRRSQPPALRMPWDATPLVIAEPVLVDGEVRGAVLTVSPTDALRRRELETWGLISAAVLLALGLGVLVSLPVVRWILHPVRRLDEGTGRVAAAVLAGGGSAPVADDSGPPELRRLSVSFDRMAATVTGALAAQRAFVADASHQLRNPLTALRLRLSNLHGHVDTVATDDHVAALEEAERLSTLLDGLLALARAERAALLVDVDVDAAVDDRVEAWRPLAEHIGLDLRRDGRPGLVVAAPEGAVETVLDAVLDNAVKFSAPGGAILVQTAVRDGSVEIAVRDSGPGIPPEELDRATDRFWRSPSQSNVEGSGLGLAIAARTVELAGGSLGLECPDGGGLRVVARLPVAVDGGSAGPGVVIGEPGT